MYVPPDPGDGGGALGCAKFVYRSVFGNKKTCANPHDDMKSSYLGPSFSEEEIETCLEENELKYRQYDERAEVVDEVAKQISEGRILGLFHGRMEWGPRALGNRSILADPRDAKMKDKVNSRVKFRESFRPFAPTVLWERWREYFEIKGKADEYPYMLVVAKVVEEKQKEIPAITHADGTARIQTLKREDNVFYHDVISRFAELTGVPVVMNTSFNIRGEPIVCKPQDAVNTFLNCKLDTLVMERFMVWKEEQGEGKREQWREKWEKYTGN